MRVFTSYESNLYHSLSGLRGGCRNDLKDGRRVLTCLIVYYHMEVTNKKVFESDTPDQSLCELEDFVFSRRRR